MNHSGPIGSTEMSADTQTTTDAEHPVATPARRDHLIIQDMPQRAHIFTPTDDWTGVTSTQQRRKLQNRLNQRAWRLYTTYSRCGWRPCGSMVIQSSD